MVSAQYLCPQLTLQTVALIEKVRSVELLFDELDAAVATFQSWSMLNCKTGCGKCCFKPDIEATTLEFIPLAHYLYKSGLAIDWLEKLTSRAQALCVMLEPTRTSGLCSQYRHRGLICRLFGFSARINKYGAREMITCQVIKTEQSQTFLATQQAMTGGATIPVMSQYYARLQSIDGDLSREFFPINVAIRKAIETVIHYYAYRE